MNFDLLRILEPSKKAGLRIPALFFENAGSPGSAYNFKCVLLPASCFQIRNLGCCGFARKNAGSRKQGARPTFLNPASCKTPLSRCQFGCLPLATPVSFATTNRFAPFHILVRGENQPQRPISRSTRVFDSLASCPQPRVCDFQVECSLPCASRLL